VALLSRFNLNSFQTQTLFLLEERGPGVYTQEMLIEGNSLLSSVYVESADPGATVEVKYYDFTTGLKTVERFDLNDPHPVISDAEAPITDRRLVSKIHNKPIIEVTVLNGNVKFGVYVTVVLSFATDLDAALQLDGETANLSTDKGMPFMCYDEATGKFHFIRCDGGTLPVSIAGEVGDPVHLTYNGLSTPGIEQTLISSTVPVGKSRNMSKIYMSGRQPGTYTIDDGTNIIGTGRIGPSNLVSTFRWEPRLELVSGTSTNLKFTSLSGTPASDIDAYYMALDVDNT